MIKRAHYPEGITVAFQPLEARDALGRNLTYGLLDRLGSMIVGGAFAGRPFPTEAELSETHGVSRSVTREAVKMLTAKGLVSARPRQGTIIQPDSQWNLFDPDVLRWMLERRFSIDLLTHFGQLRVAIEPAAAALAAREASEDGLARSAPALPACRRPMPGRMTCWKPTSRSTSPSSRLRAIRSSASSAMSSPPRSRPRSAIPTASLAAAPIWKRTKW
jgi:hypothetical protein